ncbi:MAG: aminoglycoside phosphotransferase family protein [Gammaproteobacteria bacterium]
MYLKTLSTNVINIWGKEGKSWLNQLSKIIERLSEHWHLYDINPVENMSYNYVAKATLNNKTPVILKVSFDKQLITDEYRALKHFNGQGAIKALDIHHDLNALLLEQAIPGELLKSQYMNDLKNTIKLYSNVVKKLALQPRPDSHFTHVEKWCDTLERIHDNHIETDHIIKAKNLRNFLLNSVESQYLCHGDLHLENIIYIIITSGFALTQRAL